MLGDSGRSERLAGRYLPYIGHVGPQTVLLESGALLAIARVEGTPFELADHAARNARLRLLNTLYRNIADDNVTIHTHLVRHADTTPGVRRSFRSNFAAGLDAAYCKSALANRLYRNEHLISLVVAPRSILGTGFGRFQSKFGRSRNARSKFRRPRLDAQNFPEIAEGLTRELEDQWLILANGLV